MIADRTPITVHHRAAPVGSRQILFASLWTISAALLAGLVVRARHQHATPTSAQLLAFVALTACTASLLLWLVRPATATLGGATITRRGPFALAIAAAVLVLFPPGILGTPVLVAVALVAIGVLWRLRRRPSGRAIRYALVLGVIAALAGLGDWWVRRDLGGLLWGALQLPLVLVTLLAGWGVARKVGWAEAGIGPSRVLASGPRAGLRSFLVGMALSLPWALGNLVFRAFEGDAVRAWWQPLTALQPGIAEEAWGRVFLIALLFLAFRRFARPPRRWPRRWSASTGSPSCTCRATPSRRSSWARCSPCRWRGSGCDGTWRRQSASTSRRTCCASRRPT